MMSKKDEYYKSHLNANQCQTPLRFRVDSAEASLENPVKALT